MDPDWWFPEIGANNIEIFAKWLCHRCPLKEECFEFSEAYDLRFPDNEAILAGKTLEERKRYRNRLEAERVKKWMA